MRRRMQLKFHARLVLTLSAGQAIARSAPQGSSVRLLPKTANICAILVRSLLVVPPLALSALLGTSALPRAMLRWMCVDQATSRTLAMASAKSVLPATLALCQTMGL